MAKSKNGKGKIIDALPPAQQKALKKQILQDLTFEDLRTIGRELVKFHEADRAGWARRACQFCKTWT